MAAVIKTRLDLVLLGIQTRLIAALSWPAERVLIMDPDAIDYDPQADHYLMIWPESESPNAPIFQGAGRYDTRVTERVTFTIRTRYMVDETTSLQAWLTDASQGHLRARHRVWDALVAYQVTDDGTESGNWLVACPIEPASGGRPRKTRQRAPGWGESSLSFSVTYVLDLDITYV